MDTFDLLVVFKDGSEVVVKNITNYELHADMGTVRFEVMKNSFCQFFNWDEIRYFGRLSDLRQQEI